MSKIDATKDVDVLADVVAELDVNDDAAVHQYCSSQSNSDKPRNYITQLMFEMEDSLLELDATDITIPKLEEMAIFIFESMSISSRNYHSVQHVFDIITHDVRLDNNPIAILSACFHDCIYYHVDGGLTPVQAALLEGSFKVESKGDDGSQKNYKFFATDRKSPGDSSSDNPIRHLQMVETIFGYTPGQHIKVAYQGLNEFLSAVVAVRMLRDHVSMEVLAHIACCIEATIPFKQVDPVTGKTHMDHLYDNMKEATRDYNLKLSDEDLVTSVQRACLLSNSDVGNFGTEDRHWFLDNTWSLLPETNESLRNEYVYSVDNFHMSLFKMYGFFGFLQPEVVFHDFQNVPVVSEMDQLTQECRNNLAFGSTYIGAKLLAMSVVSAVAVLTGGDAPISLFTGDLRPSERRSSQVTRASITKNLARSKLGRQNARSSDFFKNASKCNLKNPPDECLKKCNQLVYEILAVGRRSESSFDTKQSPWAALLYGYVGDEGLNRILKDHTLYPMTEERAWKLLRALPTEPVHSIVNTMAEQALSRADKIVDVISQLESKHD